jgi:uncharacterized FlaG/YvyC family protein
MRLAGVPLEVMDVTGLGAIAPAFTNAVEAKKMDKLADNREVIQAVKALNQTEAFGPNNELTFKMDRNTHKPVIRVVDRKTGETVTQLPPEYVLRLAAESKSAQ